MIFVTGDTHGDFRRFSSDAWPEGHNLTRGDYVIILGDFGGVWAPDSKRDDWWLDWLEDKPWTTLFIDGNHENHELLAQLPVKQWRGGATHEVRSHILHLMRGEIFNLPTGHGDKTVSVFTMGGAASHDIHNGVFEPGENIPRWVMAMGGYRINHVSWWAEELPSHEERAKARKSLIACNHKVDYIMTHCAPTSIAALMGHHEADKLTDFLETVALTTDFKKWLFGHYHQEVVLPSGKYECMYENIERLA